MFNGGKIEYRYNQNKRQEAKGCAGRYLNLNNSNKMKLKKSFLFVCLGKSQKNGPGQYGLTPPSPSLMAPLTFFLFGYGFWHFNPFPIFLTKELYILANISINQLKQRLADRQEKDLLKSLKSWCLIRTYKKSPTT